MISEQWIVENMGKKAANVSSWNLLDGNCIESRKPKWGPYVLPAEFRTWAPPLYEGESKIFRTDAVKIIKVTIRPISRYHLRSSSLPPVDTGPTVSSIFVTLAGSPFLSECQALSAIWSGSCQCYLTGLRSASILFLEIGRSHRMPNQGSREGVEWQAFFISSETAGWGRKCETWRCHDETSRSVPAKVRGDAFARSHAVAAKHRSSTRNSQFGLLGPVLRATTTAV
jgi:hypothetical protein